MRIVTNPWYPVPAGLPFLAPFDTAPSNAIVWFVALIVFRQTIQVIDVIGATLIFVGLPFVHIKRDATGSILRSSWPYLAAACIAGYHLCYGRALVLDNQPLLLFTVALSISVPIFILVSRRKPSLLFRFESNSEMLLGLIGGIVCGASFLVFLFGLRDAGPGPAISLRNTSIVFAQGYAWFLGERPSLIQWIGILLISVGAIVLA